jgi:glycosyltransferase involved in cell wall biosynthesis
MDITVIICTYNRAETLRLLRSTQAAAFLNAVRRNRNVIRTSQRGKEII